MRRVVLMLFLALVAVTAVAAVPSAASAHPSLLAFRGLGVWIDIYDSAYWNDPQGAVATAAAHGVRTIYIETANYHTTVDKTTQVYQPAQLGALIDAAHA